MAVGDITLFDEAKAYMLDGGWESSDSIKIALVTSTPAASDAVPSMGGGTTNYTDVTAGGNYVAGGETLDTLANCITESNGTVTFDDTGASVTWARHASNPTNARYAIVYNDTDSSNRAIGFIDLGAVIDMSAGDLTLTWASTGLFRIDGPYDTFDGSGALDAAKWDTYDADSDTSAELTITQLSGRYNAAISSGNVDDTLWFNTSQGRHDYVTISGDFDFIARSIGLAATPTPDENDFQFCGVMVWLADHEYEFAVVGNRSNPGNTVECKITDDAGGGDSEVEDLGQDYASSYKMDIRVTRVGSTVRWYVQDPGTSPDSWTEITSTFDGMTKARTSFSTGSVRIGLITYGQGSVAAFTGHCDQVEIPTGTPS